MISTQNSLFSPLGLETAPEKSRPLLEKTRQVVQVHSEHVWNVC